MYFVRKLCDAVLLLYVESTFVYAVCRNGVSELAAGQLMKHETVLSGVDDSTVVKLLKFFRNITSARLTRSTFFNSSKEASLSRLFQVTIVKFLLFFYFVSLFRPRKHFYSRYYTNETDCLLKTVCFVIFFYFV